MNTRARVRLLACLLVLGGTSACRGYWEWTPETGRWLNPKLAVKDTPEKQFQWAESFRLVRDWPTAIREHRKLIRHFPASAFAGESWFAIARIHQDSGNLEEAFQSCQKLIDSYPQSPRVIDAVKMQSEIAEATLRSKASRVFDFLRGDEWKTRRMTAVIENDPYAQETASRCVRVGLHYADEKKYQEAEKMFQRVVTEFPQSPSAQDAKFHLIRIHYQSVPAVTTDIAKYQKLDSEIREFLLQFPESAHRQEVLKIQSRLAEDAAGNLYQVASYYERTGQSAAAAAYYRKLARDFPNTSHGKIAQQKVPSRP